MELWILVHNFVTKLYLKHVLATAVKEDGPESGVVVRHLGSHTVSCYAIKALPAIMDIKPSALINYSY